MTPQFLRDEAARFRGMAEDADREATKLRLLAMAADYEARAAVAEEPSGSDPGIADSELIEPTPSAEPNVMLGRKSARGSKTVVVERRPTGRPRRE